MQNLHIAEAGFGYIFKCIGLYYEGNIYFILYLLSLLVLSVDWQLLFAGEKTNIKDALFRPTDSIKRRREVFLPQFLMMALTVYNPVFPVLLNSFFDVNKEYYRFLWMAPVIICVSAAGVEAVTVYAVAGGNRDVNDGDKDKRAEINARGYIRQVICAVLFGCILMTGGSWLYKGGYIVSPNIYHMPTEIPEVAEIIHKDALSKNPKDEYPRAMLEYDYNMLMRQYDASIRLACDREAYLTAVSGGLGYDTIMADENYYNRLLAVVALGMEIPFDEFIKGLEETGTSYVVVSTANQMLPYLTRCGMEVVSQTANHTVLYYKLSDYEPFEKPDYSEVWSLSKQPYDFLL
ncbi:MAG: hypothetical protein K6G03_02965 [Lachnospiraceae bacterium]|nr:hypothetical protein [Lachnospiraceae bacterium]